jgi:acetyl-CoA acyltransferase
VLAKLGPSIARRYPAGLVNQGVAAELIAEKWELSRQRLDEYAARSHRLAAEAASSGGFDNEIVPSADRRASQAPLRRR